MEERIYAAIDLKSFFASVECVERGLDPLDVNLVVADAARTDKTICLAASPALKSFGISGRARLFEVIATVNRLNRSRVRGFRDESLKEINRYNAIYRESRATETDLPKGDEKTVGKAETAIVEEIAKSMSLKELQKDGHRKINFIIAVPRMGLYVDYSMRIYDIYLKYVSPEDIFAYSIDEVYIDLTPYLKIYGLSAKELVRKMLLDVYSDTKITATAGIGTNLYLSKIAMDIVAKRSMADERGTRIAFLDPYQFRRTLWEHLPLTDFWGIGAGIAKRLNEHGLYTVGDIARCSVGGEKDYYNAGLLYRLFGVNAEILMDHAWGIEPVTLKDVKSYIPSARSLSSGQVLGEPYTFEMARIIVMEMAEKMAFRLTEKKYMTSMLVIDVGYDAAREGGKDTEPDRYGRPVPKSGHGSIRIEPSTNLANRLIRKAVELFEQIAEKNLWIRRIHIAATRLEFCSGASRQVGSTVFQSFFDVTSGGADSHAQCEQREEKLQKAVLEIKKKHGKNAILRGYSFQKGATARDRNRQIGGHRE